MAVIAVALTTGFVLAMETAEGAGNVSYDCGYHDTPGECSVLTLDNGEQVSITPQNVKLHASRNECQLIDSVRLTYIPKMDSSIREVV
ncbi:MAG: hypothetical protein ACLSDJ_05415 [Butyricimonas faecihominis]